MARARSPFAGVLGDFDIFHPGVEESVPLNADGTITVTVDDNGDHDSFHARVFDVCELHAPPFSNCALPNCVPLTNVSGNTWSGAVPAGFLDPFDILEHTKQIVVYGTIDGTGTSAQHQKFRINRAGSAALPCGSMSGSGSGSQGSCRFCADLTPVPVCLMLTYTQSIQNGTSCGDCAELNADFVLQHSNDPCLTCCWFSGPVDFCSDGSMGYWKLEKIDARNWEAGVYYSESGHVSFPIVLYKFTTGADNDCVISLQQPLVLTLDANSVGDECSNWPTTIRFTPA